ncbi:hypothetical protein [Rothia terrae]|uniref:Uncharacterized protein n=1 Tax=Rothia terrae TaxID=396015 RepID=A0A7H2BCS3_9MICC|nr:hypothetical protein [Rothia terrae]QNV37469.1 hypothetical protein IDM49_09620 [Rothia terrae]
MAVSRVAALVRGWTVATCATMLGAASHGLAGGELPHPLVWALCTSLSAMVSVFIAGRGLGRLPLALAVAASQGIYHLIFSGHHGAHLSSVAGAGHAHHAAVQQLNVVTVAHEPASWGMWASHLVAAVITFAVLSRGEHALIRCAHLASASIERLWQLVTVQLRIPAKVIRLCIDYAPTSRLYLLVKACGSRGPPVPCGPFVTHSFSTL